jgi:hypothetical protein
VVDSNSGPQRRPLLTQELPHLAVVESSQFDPEATFVARSPMATSRPFWSSRMRSLLLQNRSFGDARVRFAERNGIPLRMMIPDDCRHERNLSGRSNLDCEGLAVDAEALLRQQGYMLTNPSLATARAWLKHKARLPAVGRGDKNLNWRFGSYARLLKTLGHTDGMAESIEVATRDFIAAAIASGDPQGYLLQRAAHHGIVVMELDIPNIPIRAANLYVVGAYQQLEGYLYEMVDEYALVSGTSPRRRKEGEAPLDWALDIMPDGLSTNRQRIWYERYLTLEYYHQVRNLFTHPRKGRSAIVAAHKRLSNLAPVFQADYGLGAPNLPEALTLDDFLLFTRMIKYLGTDLCRICQPAGGAVVDHAVRLAASGDRQLRGLPEEARNPEKRRAKLARYYKGKFGCQIGAADLDAMAKALP